VGTSVFVVNPVSPCLSFFCSASTVAAYVFTAPTCKTTINGLEPCALNADFQHSIPRFNKFFLLYGGFGVKRRPKDINMNIFEKIVSWNFIFF
jgi:hypothetical protein